MIARRLFFPVFVLLLVCLPARAFQITDKRPSPRPTPKAETHVAEDELSRHLSAAETYQLSGDLEHAGVENRFIVSLALQRIANITVRQRDLKRATDVLNEALLARDAADPRTDLALVYMELGDIDEGLRHAQAAVISTPTMVPLRKHSGGFIIDGRLCGRNSGP